MVGHPNRALANRIIVALFPGAEVGAWEGFTAHGIRGTISFPNPTTLLIEDFSYDGLGIGKC